ncbi:RNA polymerase sigma factor [Gaoshiqia sp. Z1-71]|uniref:RNA polymerase sigma factor n=1 Tax=Gaoshiqia hydrogeniformans TaxID=3290090 RepID=UPI003BF90C61
MKRAASYTEQELVTLLSKNSPIAFQQLFDRYSQKMYRFSLSYLKSDTEAEEIVQDVFMKLWENRGNLKSDKSVKSYLFTIAFNAIKKKFNQKMKNEKYKHDLFQWLGQEKPSLESRLDFESLLEKLDTLIEQLPEKRKAIFLQRKKEGKSIQSISEEMGISPKTVKNQITEAMNFLKKSFAADDDVSAMLFYFLFIS